MRILRDYPEKSPAYQFITCMRPLGISLEKRVIPLCERLSNFCPYSRQW
nr:MAG TPA: hypothetical protein [Caudoviricetes sp.]